MNKTLADERKRLVRAQASREELRTAREAGKLVVAKDVELRWSGIITEARNKLLGIPTQLKGRRPSITREDLAALDELLREALERLADGRKVEVGKPAEAKPS